MLRQAADQGFKLHLMTGDSIATGEFWQVAGPAGEGTLFTFPVDPRRSPTAVKALAQFKAQNYDPKASPYSPTAWCRPSPRGVKRAGSDDPKKVAKALEGGDKVSTVLGDVAFDPHGDIKDPRYDINAWHAGKYAPIAQ